MNIQQALEQHPEWIFQAMEKNPEKFAETLQKVTMEARKSQQAKAEKEAKNQIEEELKNPKNPVIDADRVVFGKADAPITVVEYSDFQCPYCQRGFDTMNQLKQKYGDKVKVYFKHLPLSFHPMAMPAAKRFEAIALQSADKAKKFHDEVFKNQGSLSGGEKYLDSVAQKLGVNMAKMKKDMDSEKVTARIEADKQEAEKFGISGTPGYIVSGVSIKGAYPLETFSEIIDRKLASTK
jgi:protein-disulfide isomerase